jgi:hypothetical protein
MPQTANTIYHKYSSTAINYNTHHHEILTSGRYLRIRWESMMHQSPLCVSEPPENDSFRSDLFFFIIRTLFLIYISNPFFLFVGIRLLSNRNIRWRLTNFEQLTNNHHYFHHHHHHHGDVIELYSSSVRLENSFSIKGVPLFSSRNFWTAR